MSIEGDILTNAFGNSNAQQAYQQSGSTLDDIKADLPNLIPDEPLANEQPAPRMPSAVHEGAVTPGEAILNTIQKVSDAHANAMHALQEVTKGLNDKDTMTMADAVKMQVGVMKWQLQNELTSKVAGSVSNGVQTLMRNQ
jgi:hypothetical protein